MNLVEVQWTIANQANTSVICSERRRTVARRASSTYRKPNGAQAIRSRLSAPLYDDDNLFAMMTGIYPRFTTDATPQSTDER
jgi:hypothetical protein